MFAVTTVMSCKKLEELNVDKKNAAEAPSETLFSNAQKNLVDQVTTSSVNFNVLRLFSQYWAATTYPDESNYNITTRAIPDQEFQSIYRDVLMDLKEAKRIIMAESEVVSTAEEKKNKIAITEILTVYAYQRLVDIFGNVPYEKALDINNISPAYDDAQTIYSKLFARLDAAIADLKPGVSTFGSADVIYEGNTEKWEKFANSLKLKMAITVADVPALDPAGKIAGAIAGGLFTSSADNASYAYLGAAPNTNPMYAQVVLSGRLDWVAANTIVDKMNELNDPRRKHYFKGNLKDAGGNVIYKGGIYGGSNTFSLYTQLQAYYNKDEDPHPAWTASRPGVLIDYAEVKFYLAEAAARGFIGGSAQTFYNEAITESIKFWGGTDAEALIYVAQPAVLYSPASWKEKIATQAWIHYFERGDLGWTTWRRLDAPKFNPPASMTNADIPTRYTYPVGEQTLNGSNYTSAASAIGGDKLTTKLFWDKY